MIYSKKLLCWMVVLCLLLAGCASTAPEPAPQDEAPESAEALEESTPAGEETAPPDESSESADPAPSAQAASDNEQYDIVIVGAGGAGFSAALSAYDHGADNILVVEKLASVGGGTARATGGIHAIETRFMEADGKDETLPHLYETALSRAAGIGDPEILAMYSVRSRDIISWLDSLGREWGIIEGENLHKPSNGSFPGADLVSALYTEATDRGIEVRINTAATELLTDDEGRISGVVVEGKNGTYTIDCTAVVLATGGFGASEEMLVAENPKLAGIYLANAPGSHGDGITMARKLGAATVNMDHIEFFPAADPENIANRVPDTLVRSGVVYINLNGERFVNELHDSPRELVEAVLEQPQGEFYAVWNDTLYQQWLAGEADLDFYDRTRLEGFLRTDKLLQADTLEELAALMGVDAEALAASIGDIATSDVGNEAAPAAASTYAQGPYYAIKETSGAGHTLGGLVVDINGRVRDEDGKIIRGLFAGGEVVGNAMGGAYYYGLVDAVIMGSVAGESAVYYVEDRGGLTAHVPFQRESAGDSAPAVQGSFPDGTHTGSAQGHNGQLQVEVIVEDSSITAINVVEHEETEVLFQGVLDSLIPAIIATQSLEVDIISGATVSSNAVIEAVSQALGAD